jgi:hypothetical protein
MPRLQIQNSTLTLCLSSLLGDVSKSVPIMKIVDSVYMLPTLYLALALLRRVHEVPLFIETCSNQTGLLYYNLADYEEG